MRARAATLIRQIRSDVRAGDCRSAQRTFDVLVPLIGSKGPARLKGKTVARLWGMVNACRWSPARGFGRTRRRRR